MAAIVWALLTVLPTAASFSAQRAEDPLPEAKPLGEPLGEPLPVPTGPQSALRFIARFSADGKTVLTARHPWYPGLKAAIAPRLWDAATAKPLGPPLAVSPTFGQPLYVGFHEKTVVTARLGVFDEPKSKMSGIQSWEAATGKLVWGPVAVDDDGKVEVVMFSPDGKTIVIVGPSTNSWLLDAATGKAIGEPLEHPIRVSSVAFSPDGKTVATGTGSRFPTAKVNGEVRFWHVATGKPRGDPLPHEGAVLHIGFSPDSKTVLTTAMGENKRSLRVWDTATGKPLGDPLHFPLPNAPKGPKGPNFAYGTAVAYSPDGRTVLAATADKTAQLWDVVTSKTRGEALRHGDLVYRAAFSPEGKVLLTASGNSKKPSEVRLWDVATSKPFCRIPHKGDVTAAIFSPDGTVLLLASPQETRLWDVRKLSK